MIDGVESGERAGNDDACDDDRFTHSGRGSTISSSQQQSATTFAIEKI